MTGSASYSAARRLRGVLTLPPSTSSVVASHGHSVNHPRDVVSRHDGACLEDCFESPPFCRPQLEVFGPGWRQHPNCHHASLTCSEQRELDGGGGAATGRRRGRATAEFKAAWTAFKARQTPEALARAYRAMNLREDEQ